MTDLPGLDLPRFAAWFDGACPGQIGGPLSGRLLAGGRSNLTYEVSDGDARAGWCAARRSGTCSPPRTTWGASTA